MAVAWRILAAVIGMVVGLIVGMVVLFFAHQILIELMDPPLCPLFENPKGCVLNPSPWVEWTSWLLGITAAAATFAFVLWGFRHSN